MLGQVQTPLHSCAERNWIRSDIGAILARQQIQTEYRVSILTFIPCTKKEKGLGPVSYFPALHNWFPLCRRPFFCFCGSLFLQDSFESLHSTFSCSSITSRKHGSQYATQLPTFQPLTVSSFSKTKQDIQKYSLHRKQVYFVFLKQKGQDWTSLPTIFLNLVFFSRQLRKKERYCAPYESPAAMVARSGQNHYNKIAPQFNFNPTAQQILWTCCVFLSSL